MAEQARFPMIIGRAELISFPDSDLIFVPAKVDTGAYRSAIHAANIHVKQTPSGDVLAFDLLEGHMCAPKTVHLEASEFARVAVENSFGHREDRYEVRLRVKIGPKVFLTGFTLADRSKKIYPVLLGRKFLRRRFLVDVNNTSIDRTALKERYNIQLPDDEEAEYPEES